MVSRQLVLTKIFGDPQKRLLKGLQKKVITINGLEEKYKKNVEDRAARTDYGAQKTA